MSVYVDSALAAAVKVAADLQQCQRRLAAANELLRLAREWIMSEVDVEFEPDVVKRIDAHLQESGQ